MSSTTVRPTTYPDRRLHGGAAPDKGPRAPRVSGHESFKPEQADPRYRESSPQAAFGPGGTSHKRTASGNPRPASRATPTEERRTEKVQVTTRETLISHARSPDRRNGLVHVPKAKAKPTAADGVKARPGETRNKEARPEAPQGSLVVQFLSFSGWKETG